MPSKVEPMRVEVSECNECAAIYQSGQNGLCCYLKDGRTLEGWMPGPPDWCPLPVLVVLADATS